MENPDKGFAGRSVNSAITALSAAVLIAVSPNISHAIKTETSDNDHVSIIVPPYGELAAGEYGGEPGGEYGQKRIVNRNPHDLSVSRDFKFYNQVASLDLTDPAQAETFLQFMDIRLAEKKLNEEVVLVSDPESKAGRPQVMVPAELQIASKPEMENETIVVRQIPARTDMTQDSKTQAPAKQEAAKIARPTKLHTQRTQQGARYGSLLKGNSKFSEAKSALDKEKEQARLVRVREARLAREQARKKADEQRLAREAEEKARLEEPRLAEERRKAKRKAKAEELRLAEENRKAEKKSSERAYAEQKRREKAEALAKDKKHKEERERIRQQKEKERLLVEKKKHEALLVQQKTEEEPPKQSAIPLLPGRPVAYQIAAEQDPGIINFDQAIARRFKVAGSYLDKGEYGNNIVKDYRGREFTNVMAFWDVLVEHRSNGENYYYGSIQFPLGSRHPAIIKSTVPGDEIMLGCKAGEIVVLKGFETEGIDYTHGLVDAYLAHSVVMPDGTIAYQEVIRQPSFSLVNVETDCMPHDIFSRNHVDPQRMGHDKTLTPLPVRE
ncbi:hypothetical protein [Endozoicomonas sp. ONNA2]|uniref:hypothetical protein n=1 Tax=Endozoicomonas sp. ONNA2 TaxID=2828741 RepID=UPI002147C663|nr:hypothetical protein [Endozoicomonas sp. ONNA2]